MHSFRWAIVDVETTGLRVTCDEITEIAVLIINEEGIEQRWHRLLKPKRGIPQAISALTGITNDLVNEESSFEAIADELLVLMQGCVLVAHNARFDFGFLKNSFKRAGLRYQAPVLCTIKLLKALCPDLGSYDLVSIAQTFELFPATQHRAQADVDTLYQLIQRLSEKVTWERLVTQAKGIYQQSSLPSKLTTDISRLPDTPGVYLFYGDTNDLPLYIGKSIKLRQRILSHFSGDYTHSKEFALNQQVSRVEIVPTAGELSALLLESELIKKHMPVFNRRLRRKKNLVGFALREKGGYYEVAIQSGQVDDEDELAAQGLIGAFRSMTAAKRVLLGLVKTHRLCPKLCGLEQGRGACFSYQLKQCNGACVQEEAVACYNLRIQEAFKNYQMKAWPYSGAIAIKEHCPVNQLTRFIIVEQWRYLGTVNESCQLDEWASGRQRAAEKAATYDDARILWSYFKNANLDEQIIALN